MDSSSESQTQDADNVEQDEEDSAENEPSDEDVKYRILPSLEEKFKPLKAKEVIHNVLFDQLSTKEYNHEEANKWTTEIADTIRHKIKEFQLSKYKIIVNVVLGQNNGAGVKMATRCIWDAEADCYAHDSFTNDSLFCVATVYAVYNY